MSRLKNEISPPKKRGRKPSSEDYDFGLSKNSKSKLKSLTAKQRKFCLEYTVDWNATRAAKAAGYAKKTAYSQGQRLLKNVEVQAFIEECQNNIETDLGLSKKRVLMEIMKVGFGSISHLHETWITKKDFERLTPDERASIAEISTQTRTVSEYNPESDEKEPVKVEFVKIRLYDKLKAIDQIIKVQGYEAAKNIDIQLTEIKKLISDMSEENLIKLAEKIIEIQNKEA